MEIKLDKVTHKSQGHLKATFTARVTLGKAEFVLPELKAIAGSNGLYIELPGKSKNLAAKGNAAKWKTFPFYFFNKFVKDEIETTIANYLKKVEP